MVCRVQQGQNSLGAKTRLSDHSAYLVSTDLGDAAEEGTSEAKACENGQGLEKWNQSSKFC